MNKDKCDRQNCRINNSVGFLHCSHCGWNEEDDDEVKFSISEIVAVAKGNQMAMVADAKEMVTDYQTDVAIACGEISIEVLRVKDLHPKFASAHEAYAVALEEFDELWSAIKKKECNYNLAAMRNEAKQVAAMMIRLMVELTQNG